MTIEYLDPRSEPGLQADPYDLKIDLKEPGVSVGLLANGFPDSVNFLNEIGIALKNRVPNIVLEVFDKGNASVIASNSLLDDITGKCRAVITAYGH